MCTDRATIRVFISYSSKDLAFVSKVVQQLDDAGIFTFFAAVDIRPGMDLLSWMNTNIERSSHLVLFWSKNAAESYWVKQEWQSSFWQFVEEGVKTIIPVRLDETPLPAMLRPILYLDSTGGESVVALGIKTAILPREEFQTLRRKRLRELTGYDIAIAQIEQDSRILAAQKPQKVIFAIYDFFYPPAQEGVFLSLLRSTGLRSVVGMERKGVSGGIMRLTGHLAGPRDAFEHMSRLLAAHGYRAVKMG